MRYDKNILKNASFILKNEFCIVLKVFCKMGDNKCF